MTPRPVLLLGVGNDLYSDDGAGPCAVRKAGSLVDRAVVDVVETTAAGFRLLDLIAGRRAVVIIDAVVTGQVPPGEVVEIRVGRAREDWRGIAMPAGEHQMEIGTLLALGRAMGLQMPEVIEIYGIEARDVSPGEGLSPPVEAALPAAADLVARRASYWARCCQREEEPV